MQSGRKYEICVRTSFLAHHRLKYSDGKQDEVHSHQWIAEVHVESKRLNVEGLVIDFRKVNEMLEDILASIKEKEINSIEPFTRINPSAENLCQWLYEQIKPLIVQPCYLSKVVLWETQNYCACYSEKNE